MTQEQENQWRYAKALEIAVLIKGPHPKEFENPQVYLVDYERLVSTIMKRIKDHSNGGYGMT
jgi:hypothetical protein